MNGADTMDMDDPDGFVAACAASLVTGNFDVDFTAFNEIKDLASICLDDFDLDAVASCEDFTNENQLNPDKAYQSSDHLDEGIKEESEDVSLYSRVCQSIQGQFSESALTPEELAMVSADCENQQNQEKEYHNSQIHDQDVKKESEDVSLYSRKCQSIQGPFSESVLTPEELAMVSADRENQQNKEKEFNNSEIRGRDVKEESENGDLYSRECQSIQGQFSESALTPEGAMISGDNNVGETYTNFLLPDNPSIIDVNYLNSVFPQVPMDLGFDYLNADYLTENKTVDFESEKSSRDKFAPGRRHLSSEDKTITSDTFSNTKTLNKSKSFKYAQLTAHIPKSQNVKINSKPRRNCVKKECKCRSNMKVNIEKLNSKLESNMENSSKSRSNMKINPKQSGNIVKKNSESIRSIVKINSKPKSNNVKINCEPKRNNVKINSKPCRSNLKTNSGPKRNNVKINCELKRNNVKINSEPESNIVKINSKPCRSNLKTNSGPKRNNVKINCELKRNNVKINSELKSNNVKINSKPCRSNLKTNSGPKRNNVKINCEPKRNNVKINSELKSNNVKINSKPCRSNLKTNSDPKNNSVKMNSTKESPVKNSKKSIPPENKVVKKFSVADVLAYCRGVDPKEINIENEFITIKEEKLKAPPLPLPVDIKQEVAPEARRSDGPCYNCSTSKPSSPWYISNDSNMLICRECFASCSTESEMTEHIRTHGESRTKCPQCTLVFSCSLCLSKHIDHSHESVTYHCHHCGKVFASRDFIWRHMYKHMGNRFTCQYCDKTFPYKVSLTYHTNKHVGVKFTCAHCTFFTFTKQTLVVHLRRHHSSVFLPPSGGHTHFACPKCSKVYKSNESLKDHLKFIHSPTYGKFKCEKCGKRFGCATNMKTHLRIHNGFKLACRYCPKEFNYRSNWKEHMLNHEGATFRCTICNKNYSRRQNLLRHVRSDHLVTAYVTSELIGANGTASIKIEPKEEFEK